MVRRTVEVCDLARRAVASPPSICALSGNLKVRENAGRRARSVSASEARTYRAQTATNRNGGKLASGAVHNRMGHHRRPTPERGGWTLGPTHSRFHGRGVGRGPFTGETLTVSGNRRDCGEVHYITIGLLDVVTPVLGWTPRGDACGIASTRRANERQRRFYGPRF